MKLLKKRKGFTIVELVIVIAVIAVLAAVLIPTFINLTSKANKASDESLVTSLNKALAIEEVDHDINNMHDAVDSLKREGYLASTLVTKSDQKLLYNVEENRFLLEEDKKSDIPDNEYWTIQNSYDSANQQYSIYAADGFTNTEISGLKVGFDAGDVATISSIEYVGVSEQRDSIIRTNGGALTINAATNTVQHYGIANVVDIQAVAPTSYFENGIVSLAKIKNGRVVVTPSAVLSTLHVVATGTNYEGIKVGVVGNAQLPTFTRDDITLNAGDKKLVIEVQTLANKESVDENPQFIWISKEGEVVSTAVATSATVLDSTTIVPEASQSKTSKAAASETTEGTTAEELEEMIEVAQRYAGGQGTQKNPFLLATKAHFGSIDEDYHNGVTYGKYYKLVNDLDLGKIYPIGSMSLSGNSGAASTSYTITYASCFEGNIDGANHSITYNLVADEGLGETSNSIGLFGAIENSTIKDLTINANISSDKKDTWVGGLAGFGWRCNLENVTVNGSVVGAHDVGGFFGYYSNEGYNGSVPISTSNYFKNCVNNASVTSASKRTTYAIAGGFVGQLSPADQGFERYELLFENCQSNGNISVTSTTATYASASYFVGFLSDNAATNDIDMNFKFNGCSVGNDATFTSSKGYTHTKSNHTVYSASSAEAIAACPAIKYVGCTSRMDNVNPAHPSLNKIYINNVQQDMSLYFIQ